jgi:hypothetical protein
MEHIDSNMFSISNLFPGLMVLGVQAQAFVVLIACLLPPSLWASGKYQSQEAFLTEAFNAKVPRASLIWLDGNTHKTAGEILQHRPQQLRLRYWAKTSRSAWVLNEIGKEQPITVGIIIDNGKITTLKVLRFLEARGDEVRHTFFTKQFRQASLNTDRQLDRPIDGISGATLSVRAVNKLARLALYLDKQRLSHVTP